MERRRALKVLAAGAAGAAALPVGCRRGEPGAGAEGDVAVVVGAEGPGSGPRANPLATGTPSDPDLLDPRVPWEGVLTEEEMRVIGVLSDVIIPADDRSPGATAVGAHEFVNEWVSAPYERNREDLVLVRGGIVWLNVEAAQRFGREFVALAPDERRAICDDICHEPRAKPEHKAGARFFDRVRDLVSTAFWTTDEGMADLGYLGNRPLARWDGPPPEVLERLGLTGSRGRA